MNFRNFTALPLTTGLSLAFGAALAAASLAPLAPLPTQAQSQGVGNGNAIGSFQGGSNANGPNPSRGNAGRNSGVTSVSSSVMTPTIRFAPPGRGFSGR